MCEYCGCGDPGRVHNDDPHHTEDVELDISLRKSSDQIERNNRLARKSAQQRGRIEHRSPAGD